MMIYLSRPWAEFEALLFPDSGFHPKLLLHNNIRACDVDDLGRTFVAASSASERTNERGTNQGKFPASRWLIRSAGNRDFLTLKETFHYNASSRISPSILCAIFSAFLGQKILGPTLSLPILFAVIWRRISFHIQPCKKRGANLRKNPLKGSFFPLLPSFSFQFRTLRQGVIVISLNPREATQSHAFSLISLAMRT